jgi:hypothetical protein
MKIQSITIGGFDQKYQNNSSASVFGVEIIGGGIWAIRGCCSQIIHSSAVHVLAIKSRHPENHCELFANQI